MIGTTILYEGDDIINIKIRAERPEDYNNIANIVYNSFIEWHESDYKAEPLITASLRQNQYFDPELSIVAEIDNKIVGHALFSVFTYVVMGEERRGIFLAPLCVDTMYQKQGIGSKLIEAGHEIAGKKGISLALLCGHEKYYPRFGYKNKMFSLSGSKVILYEDNQGFEEIKEKQVHSSDLSWITKEWWHTHKDDRLAWYPGDTISQWFNHSLLYRSSVLFTENEVLGYVRYRTTYPLEVKELLPLNNNGEKMLRYIMKKRFNRLEGEVIMSLGKESVLKILSIGEHLKVEENIRTSNAFMIKILDQKDEVLNRYCNDGKLDDKNLGVIAFPTALDLDD